MVNSLVALAYGQSVCFWCAANILKMRKFLGIVHWTLIRYELITGDFFVLLFMYLWFTIFLQLVY